MRLAKKAFYYYLQENNIPNVGDFLIEIDGTFYNLENLPDSYIQEAYGCTKQELVDYIESELNWDLEI